ncbi:MAG: barstar family protein [Ruminococcus sp.]|nr:barstar family protein [Ruminococcus sp.]
MYQATIDLTNCKYLMELHERIKTGLCLDEGYGRNMDAFWDEINRNIKCNYITVKGSKTVSKDLRGTVEKMSKILEKNKQYWVHSRCPFDYEFVD